MVTKKTHWHRHPTWLAPEHIRDIGRFSDPRWQYANDVLRVPTHL
jgi:hypothetical protein